MLWQATTSGLRHVSARRRHCAWSSVVRHWLRARDGLFSGSVLVQAFSQVASLCLTPIAVLLMPLAARANLPCYFVRYAELMYSHAEVARLRGFLSSEILRLSHEQGKARFAGARELLTSEIHSLSNEQKEAPPVGQRSVVNVVNHLRRNRGAGNFADVLEVKQHEEMRRRKCRKLATELAQSSVRPEHAAKHFIPLEDIKEE